jgi:hypothetical protein
MAAEPAQTSEQGGGPQQEGESEQAGGCPICAFIE